MAVTSTVPLAGDVCGEPARAALPCKPEEQEKFTQEWKENHSELPVTGHIMPVDTSSSQNPTVTERTNPQMHLSKAESTATVQQEF